MRISDWSSDVCSSDLPHLCRDRVSGRGAREWAIGVEQVVGDPGQRAKADDDAQWRRPDHQFELHRMVPVGLVGRVLVRRAIAPGEIGRAHSELPSLMRISYAVFSLQTKTNTLIS